MKFEGLISIADKIDALGFHKEAELLDKILEKRADVLSYKEKPFMARLAKILLVLRNYESGQLIKEDLTFPISNTRITGMSRRQVVEEVQKHLETFINQYLLPNFDKKYKGTRLETRYRDFVSQAYNLLQTMRGIYSARSEQQGIREAINAVEHTKRIVGKLIVFARSHDFADETFPTGAEDLLGEIYRLFNDLEMSIKQNNKTETDKNLQKIWDTFPLSVNPDGLLFLIIHRAYTDGILPFSQEETERSTLDLLDSKTRDELLQSKSDLEKYEKEINSFNRLRQRIYDLETRTNKLEQETLSYENITPSIPATQQELGEQLQQYLTYVKKMPGTFMPPKGFEHYKKTPSAKYSRCKALEGEVSNLEIWFEKYKEEKDGQLCKTIPFSTYLSKGVDSKAATKALTMIKRNVDDLKREVEKDLVALERTYNKAKQDNAKVESEHEKKQNQVIWEKFHREYVTKMVQTVLYALSPETKGEETSKQALNRVLSEFDKVLSY